jgi:voltage-gated potassium channel
MYGCLPVALRIEATINCHAKLFEQNNINMTADTEQRVNVFQIFIAILSVYVLAALFIDTVYALPLEVSHLLNIIDDAVCVVFLFDVSYRFFTARNKVAFLKWGWIDLVSSVPTFGALRAGRAVRLVRILRILRAVRSTRMLVSFVFKNRKNGTFSLVAILSFLLMIFSSISILNVETDPASNIKTAEDALWWSFTTITTVGYGDRYPVTTEGRIIAAILTIAGVGLFGTFTGFVAAWFMNEKKST